MIHVAADAAFTAPSFEYGPLAPMLVVFTAAMVGVLVEAFAPRAQRAAIQLGLTLLALTAAFGLVIWNAAEGTNELKAEGILDEVLAS